MDSKFPEVETSHVFFDTETPTGDSKFAKNVNVTAHQEYTSIKNGKIGESSSSVLDDLIEGKSGIHLVSNAKSVANGAFACSKLGEKNPVNIGLGWYLETVNLPNATSIGAFAFTNCSVLTSVDLPNATSIGDVAFEGISPVAVINIGAAEGEIEGAPWGAPEGVTINYGSEPSDVK